MVDFQQQSPQRLVNEYEHMNSRNDRLDLQLNPLQREYYFIKYEKSYVKQCKYSCFHSLRLFSLLVCSCLLGLFLSIYGIFRRTCL